MINEDPNMGRKQIFNELTVPSKVEEKGILTLIYKGIFICVKLLLDIRLNLVKISEGKKIQTKFKQEKRGNDKNPVIKQPDNPIKGLDNIRVEDKRVLTEGKTKTNIKDSKNTAPPVESPDGDTQTDEKIKDQDQK